MDDDSPRTPAAPSEAAPLLSPEETIVLLQRAQSGDGEAVNALLARLLPRLRRWAHGRLPGAARNVFDTGDIVRTVATTALGRLTHLDVRQDGSLSWHLRQAIREEIASTLSTSLPIDDTTPLGPLLQGERLTRYDAALERLDAADRDVIHGRFELGYGYDELAHSLGTASAAAARVAVHRAVKRLLHVLPPLTDAERAASAESSPSLR